MLIVKMLQPLPGENWNESDFLKNEFWHNHKEPLPLQSSSVIFMTRRRPRSMGETGGSAGADLLKNCRSMKPVEGRPRIKALISAALVQAVF